MKNLTTDHGARERRQAIVGDENILWGVVANSRPTRTKTRMEQLQKATGNGSTVCALLCAQFGFDPYEVKK